MKTSTLVRHRPIQGESNIDTLGKSERSFPQPSWLTSGCRWSYERFLVHVGKLHIQPSRWIASQTLLVEKRTIPYSTKYIDVSRRTHTNLDVKQEKSIDDYWNIDGSRNLSDPWTKLAHFTQLGKSSWRIYVVGGGGLTRKQLTSRPGHLWPKRWKSMGKNAKPKEKAKMVWREAPSWKRKITARNPFHRPRRYGIQGKDQERA